MKKILFALTVVVSLAACTKHDPFDNLKGGEVWILSKYAADDVEEFSSSQVTFLSKDMQFRTDETFYSHSELKKDGLLDSAVKGSDGNYYRMPTSGELMMAFPQIDRDNLPPGFNASSLLIFSWSPFEGGRYSYKETACLDNKDDYTADESGDVISGDSEFYFAEDYEDDNPDVFPIFALRFKGTSQYAAYRYELCEVRPAEDNFRAVYGLKLRAKWLKSADTTTKMSDITNEDYWKDCLELIFKIEGYLGEDGYFNSYDGRLMSSTLDKYYEEDYVPVVAAYSMNEAGLQTDYNGDIIKYSLRLLKCHSDGSL